MARLVQVDSILDIPAANWDALCATGQPFVRHGFLAALEAGNSVGESNGWIPAHCLLENDDGQIVEVLTVICLFGFLNRWNDTVATELEIDPLRYATAIHEASDWNPGKHA